MDKKRFFTLTIIAIIALGLTVLAFSSKLSPAQAQTSNSTLTIAGLVENPMDLTLNDIKAMPQTTEYAALICVDAPTTPLLQGNWTGVELSYLLQQANVSSSAVKVAFFAPDGFTIDLTIPMATQDNSILVAYQLNGASLGGLRLVVPGHWGYKWIDDLTQIKLVNYNFLGTEESLGYSDDATITGGSAAPNVIVPNFPSSSPNPSTSTQNSVPTPSALPQSSTPTANPTTTPAVSNSKPQSTSAFLVYIGAASAIIVVFAVVSATTLIKRKKAQTRKPELKDSQADRMAKPMRHHRLAFNHASSDNIRMRNWGSV
jgi:hypothetical protein